LVVGISRQDIEELGVEPMVNGSVDLVLAVAAQEGAAKGGDGSLGKLKEPSWVDNDIAGCCVCGRRCCQRSQPWR